MNRKKLIKILHVVISLVWPLLVIAVLVFDEVLYFRLENYSAWSVVYLGLWLLYSYTVLLVMRNYELHQLSASDCDLDGYVECLDFQSRTGFSRRTRWLSLVGMSDALILKGDVAEAKSLLGRTRELYLKLPMKTRMLHDYFSCKLYAETEDAQNFRIGIGRFYANWIENPNLNRRLIMQAQALFQDLDFHNMLFSGNFFDPRKYLVSKYRGGEISSRYEFIRYCYDMGLIELGMGNLSIAKHWMAQTVSFNVDDFTNRKAADHLMRLDRMGVPYAPQPPMYNEYRISGGQNRGRLTPILSIICGFVLVLFLIIM